MTLSQEQRYDEAIQALLASERFHAWQPTPRKKLFLRGWNRLAMERHYTPAEISAMWGVSADFVRDIFRNEAGVLMIGKKATKVRRGYKTMRIPESVLLAVHSKLSAKPAKVG